MVGGSLPLKAALDASRTIPIVFVATAGNIEHGLITNVARPAGNATGFTLFDEFSLAGKLLGTLKEIAPGVLQVAVLMQRGHLSLAGYMHSLESDGPKLGIRVTTVPVGSASEIESAIARSSREANSGLLLPPDQFLVQHRELIVAAAARHRLPAVYGWPFRCRRRPRFLWGRCRRTLSPRSRLRRPHPQRREARRSAGAGTD
jgi:putative tryptophan/tyrosine transport system substrate-binding protein